MSGFLFTKYILLLSTLILVAWCLFTKNIVLVLTRGVGLRYYSARNSADRVGILRFLKAWSTGKALEKIRQLNKAQT